MLKLTANEAKFWQSRNELNVKSTMTNLDNIYLKIHREILSPYNKYILVNSESISQEDIDVLKQDGYKIYYDGPSGYISISWEI